MDHLQNKQSRRKFIKLMSLGATGTMISTSLYAINKGISSPKMGMALVGLGKYSTDILAPALLKTNHTYLAAIVTGTPSKEQSWAKTYNIPSKNIYNYNNFDQIASNPEIDIVYIVLPNSMHHEFTIRAAKAGKHVICEKPMAVNPAQCKEMIAVCEENNVGLSIGYRLHYEPHTQQLMQWSQTKELGNILHITSGAAWRNTNFNTWRWRPEMGGGAMMDMGVYPLQAARYATGMEPIYVSARSFTTRPGSFEGVDEVTIFQLEFPGGIIASLETGFHANFNYLNIITDNGWIRMNPFSAYSGIKMSTNKGEVNLPQINQQAQQMDEDALSFTKGETPRVPGAEGLKDLLYIEALMKSIKTGMKIPL
jgi:glucose-fructose oxidoreductase